MALADAGVANTGADARRLLTDPRLEQIKTIRQKIADAERELDDVVGPWNKLLHEVGQRVADAGFPRMDPAGDNTGVRWTGYVRAEDGWTSNSGIDRWVPGNVDGVCIDGKEIRPIPRAEGIFV